MGYHRTGFEVVGVDIRPQAHYPFAFFEADAMTFPLDGFDAIHASPPCQRYSSITKVRGNPESHPDLIEPTRERLLATGLPYVIENVERARPWLREPVTICAAAMGLHLDEDGKRYVLARHRLFETNWWLMVPPCACDRRSANVEVLGVYGGGTRQDTRIRKNLSGGNTNKANRRHAAALMDMPWATRQEMNLAIPPAYTEWIGNQLLRLLQAAA